MKPEVKALLEVLSLPFEGEPATLPSPQRELEEAEAPTLRSSELPESEPPASSAEESAPAVPLWESLGGA